MFPDELVLEEKGTIFCTLGGFDVGGPLHFVANDADDVMSVREGLNPKKYVKWWKPDLDLSANRVNPADGLTSEGFCERVLNRAFNYERNHADAPSYDTFDRNCATWVNTLLKVAGVPDGERRNLSNHFGINAGENKLISEDLFQHHG